MRAIHFCTALLLLITIGITPVRAQNPTSPTPLNRAEEYALAAYCAAQSAGEPFLCRLSIAAVMGNRLSDPRFPDTISGILQDAGYKSAPVREEDLASARWAVRLAAMGVDPTGGSLYWAWAGTADAAELTPRLTVGKRIFGVRE
ncbi:MAG: cell wall hydrolase [Clostridia bacterium]|nr:cell wall hydrolase [Clostridia bacterium]